MVNPTKLNKVLDLLSSVYERDKFRENISDPELSDVMRSRDQFMESRKNKENYADTDQINFLKKLDYKNKVKNNRTGHVNGGGGGGGGGGDEGDDDNDDDSGSKHLTTYDTQGQRSFHDAMQTKHFRKTKDGNVKLPNGKTLNIV